MAAGSSNIDLPKVQLAAGGIVWREKNGVRKLAVIHRPRYDDWSLPKGKPEPEESLAETAEREVREELGCEVKFLHFAGVVHYPLGIDRTKVVLFWHMEAAGELTFEPNTEVDEAVWLTPEKAVEKLSHGVEQRLVVECCCSKSLQPRMHTDDRG